MASAEPIASDPRQGGVATGGLLTANTKAPIKVWAAVGLVLMAFQLYVVIKWVSGPNFQKVPSGPTEYPTGLKIAFWAQHVIAWVFYPFILWKYAIGPRIRTGRFTSENLMVIWWVTFGWFWDPFANYFHPIFWYTSYGPNWGSWIADVPGWQSISAGQPGAMMSYPILFVIPSYASGVAMLVIITIGIMKWAQRRWPNLGKFYLFLVAFVIGGTLDLPLEFLWLRCGIYYFVNPPPEITLWHGHYYQFPIYEALLGALFYAAYASLFFFKNDKGQTVVERGLERLSITQRSETILRFAALAAACSAIYMVLYNFPMMLISEYHGSVPRDIQERSYFTGHICGPETDQTCGGENLPPTHRGPVVHFDPHGNLIVPPGVPPPGSESVTQFRP